MLVCANEYIGRELCLFRRFEPGETRLLAGMIRPDDICFDVGANIGYYTCLMAARAASGQVHAFEPVAFNCALLNANLQLNNFSNVVCSQIALSNHQGTTSFSSSEDGAFSSLIATGRRRELDSLQVRVDTIDGYVAAQGLPRVDVMKVDVEGAEALLVEGAMGLLSDPARRPRLVMMELTSTNLAPYGVTVTAVLNTMRSVGYRAHALELASGCLAPLEGTGRGQSENFFFVPESAC